MTGPHADITGILDAMLMGDKDAEAQLAAVVYDELHYLAHLKMAREKPGGTLQTTALVNEAYIRLMANRTQRWEDRKHFFRSAAKAMQRILVERARRRKTLKRSGGRHRVPFSEENITVDDSSVDVEALSEALEALERESPRACQIVKLRYFVGLRIEETAEVLGVSTATVRADWTTSKAWLRGRLSEGGSPEAP